MSISIKTFIYSVEELIRDVGLKKETLTKFGTILDDKWFIIAQNETDEESDPYGLLWEYIGKILGNCNEVAFDECEYRIVPSSIKNPLDE
jgi:hypothetical protein